MNAFAHLPAFRKPVLTLLCAALCWTSGPALHAQTPPAAGAVRSGGGLPTLGDGSEMTTSAERKIGDGIAKDMYRDPDYLDDPVLVDYVQSIWQPLIASAKARGDISPELEQRFAWEILLGRDRQVNAFALPGGYFGLYLGLIAIVSSRDELASVLGHELSHVTQRHISRMMTKQGSQLPWLIGAMVLGALAASKNPDAASAAIVGGQAVMAQNTLNFSRDMEREADRMGLGVMSDAGFEVRGFVGMFEKLQNASRLNDNGDFPYLRSHPLTTERIADMQSRLAGVPTAPTVMTMEQAMIGARARVLSNTSVDAMRRTLSEVGSTQVAAAPAARQAAVLYGAVLASARQRDFPTAKDNLQKLTTLVAAQPAQGQEAAQRLVTLLAAELALQTGDPVPEFQTKGRAELLYGTQAMVRDGRARDAAQQLQTWVALHPRDAGAWQQLAAANASQGLQLRALRAEAEARVAQLDNQAALDRLKAAQQYARSPQGRAGLDYIEASIVDTRARQIESQIRERAREDALKR